MAQVCCRINVHTDKPLITPKPNIVNISNWKISIFKKCVYCPVYQVIGIINVRGLVSFNGVIKSKSNGFKDNRKSNETYELYETVTVKVNLYLYETIPLPYSSKFSEIFLTYEHENAFSI